MNEDAWPSRDEPAARAPLPRVEDLPIAEQGYDRDAVQGAFDAFYRHTAQLDATLRTLETVDTFTRQAAELRADLRTLRSAGLGPQSWSSPYSAPASERVGISPAVPRIVAELVFVAAVPIVAGLVGNFDSTVVLAVTLAAWALMLLIEYTAYRSRVAPTAVPRLQPTEAAAVVLDAPVETPPTWDDVAGRHDDALTMIEPPAEAAEAASEPAAIVEPPTPEPTFPGPPAAPTIEPPAPEPSIEPPAPEPSIEPPAPEPTFPPTPPEPTFPPTPPATEPEPTPEPEPLQPVAEAEEPHRRFGVFRRSRPVEAEPVEEAQPAAEPELEPVLEAEVAPEPEPEPEPAEEPEPEFAEEPEPLVAEEKPRRLFGRRRAREAEPVLEDEAEPEPLVAEADPEPEQAEEPEPVAEEKAPRRRFGRKSARDAEPVVEAVSEPEPELEPEPEPEREPVEAYVDPWERDFDYSSPEEPEPEPALEPALEHEAEEEPAPEETTQEPLAAERSELELDEPDENGTQPVPDDGVPAAASRTPAYAPRRGRRR